MDHVYVVKDRRGNPHSYTTTRHRGSAGFQLATRVSALLVDPVIGGLGPMFVEAIGTVDVSKGAAAAMRQALDDPRVRQALDPSAIAGGLKSALLGLDLGLVVQLLAYTNRDGQPLVAEGRPTALFDEAYAGNYVELARVIWEVCSYNAFFPALDTFASVGKPAPEAGPARPENGR